MSGEAMAQRMGMGSFLEARSFTGLVTGIPNGFAIDGPIRRMVVITWKEPDSGFSRQAVPVQTKFCEQFSTEHHVPILAPFAALDVDDHTLAVDVADLQASQFGTPQTSSVERNEQCLERSAGCLDQSCD